MNKGFAITGLAAFAAVLISFAGRAEAQTGEALVVPCLDEARNVVTRTAPSNCIGRVLSPEEARAFEDDRIRRREATMREQMERDKGARPRLQRTGSGVVVSASGHVLTNRHVVNGCQRIDVAFGDGTAGKGSLLSEDPAHDLALLKTDLTPRKIAAFRSDLKNEQGLKISVVGYPSQGLPTIRPSLAPVVLNDRGDDELPVMTVVGRVRSGHSGSPLLDEGANVIGLIFAKPDEVAIYQQSGKLIDDMGLAIPTPVVLKFLRRAEVRYETASAFPSLSEEELLETASKFVIRIACY